MAINKKLLAVGIMALFLAGCELTVDDLVNNAEKRHQILKECAAMGLAAKDEKKCQIAAEAELKAGKKAAGELLDSMKK